MESAVAAELVPTQGPDKTEVPPPSPAEQDYRLAFDSAGTGLALLRLSGEWIAANQMLCRMLGYTEEELRGTSFQQLTHPDDLQVGRDEIPGLIQGQCSSVTFEKRYLRKDGSALWARLTIGIARNQKGEALYFVSQLEDISEHLALRQALLSNEQKYRSLAQNSPNIILRYNRLGQRIYANPEFERTRGFPDVPGIERTLSQSPRNRSTRCFAPICNTPCPPASRPPSCWKARTPIPGAPWRSCAT